MPPVALPAVPEPEAPPLLAPAALLLPPSVAPEAADGAPALDVPALAAPPLGCVAAPAVGPCESLPAVGVLVMSCESPSCAVLPEHATTRPRIKTECRY